MPPPFFSIVIPVYNRAALVRTAVESVLGQVCRDWEIILVDDGSSDGTPAVLAELASSAVADGRAITHLRRENGGCGAAKNTGARLARGRYVLTLDSDDVLLPRALERLKTVAESHGHPALIAGAAAVFRDAAEVPALLACDPSLEATKTEVHACFFAAEGEGFASCPSATAIRTDVYNASPGSAEHRWNATDQHLWMGIGAAAGYVRVAAPALCGLRRGHESMVSNPLKSTRGWSYVAEMERAGRYGGAPWRRERRRYVAHAVRQFLRQPHRGGALGAGLRLWWLTLPWHLADGRWSWAARFPLQAATAALLRRTNRAR